MCHFYVKANTHLLQRKTKLILLFSHENVIDDRFQSIGEKEIKFQIVLSAL